MLVAILTCKSFVMLGFGTKTNRTIRITGAQQRVQVKRMSEGIGNVPCSTYSQTLNGYTLKGFFGEPPKHVITHTWAIHGKQKIVDKR